MLRISCKCNGNEEIHQHVTRSFQSTAATFYHHTYVTLPELGLMSLRALVTKIPQDKANLAESFKTEQDNRAIYTK